MSDRDREAPWARRRIHFDLTGFLLERHESQFGRRMNRSPHHQELKTQNLYFSLHLHCQCCLQSVWIKQRVMCSPECLELKLCISPHPCQSSLPRVPLCPSLPYCDTFCSNAVDLVLQRPTENTVIQLAATFPIITTTNSMSCQTLQALAKDSQNCTAVGSND